MSRSPRAARANRAQRTDRAVNTSAGTGATSSKPDSTRTSADDPTTWPGPFKPRPVLFRVLLAVFIVWMIALLVMYFTTVRGKQPQPAEDDQPPATSPA